MIVQLDDALVRELDRVAKRHGVSRSELLRRAAAALLESERIHQKERELVAAYRAQPQDPIMTETAARLAAEAWPEI